jgi:methionyl-tRNA formyltransferase
MPYPLDLYYFSSGPRERVLEAILDAGHRVHEVIATSPKRHPKVAPSLDLARSWGIPVRLVRKRDLGSLAEELESQLFFSAGFAYIFPPELIAAAKLCLNCHGALLPKYGGARTLNWVIEKGETESGITVHQIDEGVDTGPILLQRTFPLSAFETGKSLYRKTLEFEPEVVLEALDLVARGQAVFRPQIGSDPKLLPNRCPDHSRLDPGKTLLELFDQIRAADPEDYPAYFEVAGEKICLKLWRPEKPEEEADLL